MIPVFLDFETYWSATHSLSKMSPLTYVMHPDTEIQSCAVKIGNGPTRVVFGEAKLRALFDVINWTDKIAVAHNMAEFDAMVLAWRFGIKPAMWGCTLAMARPIYAKTVGCSLKAVALALALGEKGSLEAINTKGKRLCDFTPAEIALMKIYNTQDTDLCAGIFNALASSTGVEELRLIDATVRMLVEPKFVLDVPLLTTTLKEERARKQLMLLDVATMVGAYVPGMADDEAADAACKVLSSAPKFSALLKSLSVEVPMKPSPSNPEKMIPALAKTDQEFLDLQDHADPMVAMAASARLGAKSTLLETRIEKFLEAGQQCGGLLPIPTRYYGADTTGRRSGWAYNPLNLPRISGKPSDALRNSLMAPPGYKVVVADLSGIELRINMFLWKVPYAMKLFQDSPDKADLYKTLAAEVFHVEYTAVTKLQRQAAKSMHLGCGYGVGPGKFKAVAKSIGGLTITDEEAEMYVSAYRHAHPQVTQGWKSSHDAIDWMYSGARGARSIDSWGILIPVNGGVKSPKGMIRYPGLRKEKNEKGRDEWCYGEGRHKARLYGAKGVENYVQHLARFVITDASAEVFTRTRHHPAMEVYDELVYVVPEDEAESHLATLLDVMRKSPEWFPELVLWAEGDIADTYGAAK